MTRDTNEHLGYQRILVATDFSAHGDAAVQQGLWLARHTGAQLTVAHVLPDLNRVVTSATVPGEQFESFEREIRQVADTKLRRLIADWNGVDLNVKFELLQGEPFVAIAHRAQEEGYDLVMAGSRGMAAWEQFLIGSTAKRLVRKCPASVWVVKAEHVGPPQAVLAATDFSDVSRQAVLAGWWIAKQARAKFHLLHVVDAQDVPDDIISRIPQGSSLRREIDEEAKHRFDEFVKSLGSASEGIQRHLSWGTPWREVGRLAQHLNVDLIALGTVGRSGIKGLLLGNTAERILDTCNCSIVTAKPDGFVSPL